MTIFIFSDSTEHGNCLVRFLFVVINERKSLKFIKLLTSKTTFAICYMKPVSDVPQFDGQDLEESIAN